MSDDLDDTGQRLHDRLLHMMDSCRRNVQKDHVDEVLANWIAESLVEPLRRRLLAFGADLQAACADRDRLLAESVSPAEAKLRRELAE